MISEYFRREDGNWISKAFQGKSKLQMIYGNFNVQVIIMLVDNIHLICLLLSFHPLNKQNILSI